METIPVRLWEGKNALYYFLRPDEEHEFDLWKAVNSKSPIIFCEEEFVCVKNGFYVFEIEKNMRVAIDEKNVREYVFE